jgi:hypothetical protein
MSAGKSQRASEGSRKVRLQRFNDKLIPRPYDYNSLTREIRRSSATSEHREHARDDGESKGSHGTTSRCLRGRPQRAAEYGASLRCPMPKRDRRAYRRARYRAGLETYVSLSPEAKARAFARSRASWATHFGKLKRQPCEECGATEGVERHHEDYTKPLEVQWLCPTHHWEREQAKRAVKRSSSVHRKPRGSLRLQPTGPSTNPEEHTMATVTIPQGIDIPDSGAAVIWERKRSLEADHEAGLHTELAKLGGGPGPHSDCPPCARQSRVLTEDERARIEALRTRLTATKAQLLKARLDLAQARLLARTYPSAVDEQVS